MLKNIFDKKLTNLYEAKKRGRFKIAHLPKINLLESMGLRSGTNITVQDRYSFGGPVLLRIEEAYTVALGKDIALQIAVTDLSAS